MAIYSFDHVSFRYPNESKKALDDISFSVERGEFLLLCGPSGCGKSTLLRQFKSVLTPHGESSGCVFFDGMPLAAADERTQAQKIGFVLQSPEDQVVTDKVWHELAFGLESLGCDTPTIRRRVAEIAAFFGIENWFYKNVSELSGGQKQLLSLASVMAMQPEVIILDEPTAQLDPIAAADFIALLGRINRELGTTMILSEHRLEEAFPFASRVMVMEQGHILCDGTPHQVGHMLREKGSGMFLAMPAAMQVWAAVRTSLECPLSVRDGSHFLTMRAQECPLQPLLPEKSRRCGEEILLQCEDLWFRYEKDLPDILRGLNIRLHRGEFYALLGGNGAGKTTALKAICGLGMPYCGTVTAKGNVVYLPQDPQALFVRRTVREDLEEVLRLRGFPGSEQRGKMETVVSLCRLQELLDRHPYDLSGGEKQRAALAKVLLTAPDVLLLDEPTKGFDARFKADFAAILRSLLQQGIAVLMVSHDVSFCAEHAHRCGMFFDGSIVAEGTPRDFFSGNSFYTTPANRMARHLLPQAVTIEDIICCCGGKTEMTEPEAETVCAVSLPEPPPHAVNYKPTPLPLWRKMLAAASAAVSLAVLFIAVGVTDLSAFINAEGISTAGWDQLWFYAVLLSALLVFILAVGRRSAPPLLLQTPHQKRRLSKRTLAASLLILLFVPLTIFVGVTYFDGKSYSIIALLVLLECMLPFVLIFEGRRPKARELVIIAVLCAIAVAGRSAFFMLPQFKPVMALAIIAGVAFGGETGFFVGAVSMLVSNMLFSHGPWTPWQMFSMGIIGFLAGVLFRKGWLRRSRGSLAVFGAICAVAIYGGIMNFSSAVLWNHGPINWKVISAYYITGLPMDLVHAFSTVVFLLLIAEPMLEKLDRLKVKYGLVE